jgi:hypothetical protein
MQFKDKKKAVALAVLVSVLVLYWASAYLKGGGSEKAVVPVPAKKAAATSPKSTAIRVDVGLLNKPVEPYRVAKNIFAPVYTKPVLEKPLHQSKKPGDAVVTVTPLPPLPPPPPPKSPEEIDAENAREEMRKVKVLGFLKRKQRTDVFLSLGNSNYIVGKGEVITKDYYLEDVAKDYVMVSDRKTGVQVKIPADFSGKNSKNMPPPGVGGAGGAGQPSPSPQRRGGPGRYPGQRAPERTPEGYGASSTVSGGTLPTQNSGTKNAGTQPYLENQPSPVESRSI